MRSKKARLITGAVLPVFNHPLKLAGGDRHARPRSRAAGSRSASRARSCLHEFARFGVSVHESRERFEEGMEQVRRLLKEENVTIEGKFHSFKKVTSLPRPTQKPRPPFLVNAFSTPESFISAATAGHSIMAIPMSGTGMKELLRLYRDAWRKAGHSGQGRVMLAFHMFCAETMEEAVRVARQPLNHYLKTLVAAAADWTEGLNSKDYPNYDKLIGGL